MTALRALAVFCGSRVGHDPVHRAAAVALGEEMARRRVRLVYGGGRVGLMGVLADAVLARGGEATGVIPRRLREVEVGHEGLSELHVVESMHARKQLMFELSDAAAVLPGGIGTLDETVEMITWRQLGLHDRPIVLLDAAGFWAPFLALIEAMIAGGYAGAQVRDLYAVVTTPEQLFAAIATASEAVAPATARNL